MSKVIKFIKNNLYITTFLTIITVPSLQMITNIVDLDDSIEKRNKAPEPSLSSSTNLNEYFQNYETYFNDNIGFRSKFIELHNKIDLNVFKQSPNSDVILGKEGYLFYKDEMPDYHKTNILSDKEIDYIAQKLKKFQVELADRGIYFLMSIAPNKATIYPEYIIEKSKNPNLIGNLDKLQQAFDKYKVNYVDLKAELLKAKPNNNLYYKKDTHWNKLGSNIGANAYVQHLNKIFDTNHSIESKDLKLGNYNGDLDNMLGFYSNTPETLVTDNTIINGNKFPKTLSYGDSFGGTLFETVTPLFEQNLNIHVHQAPVLNTFPVYKDNVKIVNFELVERNINHLLAYNFGIFDDQITDIEKTYKSTSIDLKTLNNVITHNLAHIPSDDSTYFASLSKENSISILNENINKKIDYLYLETNNLQNYTSLFFNFNNSNTFIENDKNIGLLLNPGKDKYVLDLRKYNLTTENIHIKLGTDINTEINLKELKLYIR